MAVRLCPWMDGMSQGARDGGVTNVQDVGWQGATNVQGWTVCCGAMDGGVTHVQDVRYVAVPWLAKS